MNMHTPQQHPSHSSRQMLPFDKWRPAVGIFITNPDDEILIGLDSRFKYTEKSRSTGWIIPQGAIDGNETPFEAAKREAFEEAGLNLSALTFKQQHPNWLTYEPWAKGYVPDGRLGSQMKWFHFKSETDALPTPDMREFVEFSWIGPNSVIGSTHPCRHAMYRQVIREFLPDYPLIF